MQDGAVGHRGVEQQLVEARALDLVHRGRIPGHAIGEGEAHSASVVSVLEMGAQLGLVGMRAEGLATDAQGFVDRQIAGQQALADVEAREDLGVEDVRLVPALGQGRRGDRAARSAADDA